MADHAADNRWSDAAVRALRTFYASVGIDILVAIGVGVTALLQNQDPMTPGFWVMVAGLVVRSIVTGIATYFVRLKFPPKET